MHVAVSEISTGYFQHQLALYRTPILDVMPDNHRSYFVSSVLSSYLLRIARQAAATARSRLVSYWYS